jgi:hypothetical protein
MRTPTAALVTFVMLFSACRETPAPQVPPEGDAATAPARNIPGRSYERNFVFTTVTEDSSFMVPWLMRAKTQPGGVSREARGWLDRNGIWEAFYEARWETPPTRTPERILPHESMRLVVREGGAVDGIIFEEGARDLELALGKELASWTGPRGESFQLLEAALFLAGRRVRGLAIDMSRASGGERPPGGDWAFLVSGDSMQLVLEADVEHGGDSPPRYEAWGRLDFRDLRWTPVTVDWTETSAFQPARRDVPTSWTITSADGELAGVLQVSSASIRPGGGAGPVLPVHALFEVTGSIVIEDRTFPVRGLIRHERR